MEAAVPQTNNDNASTLNIMCAICSEFYRVDDEVFSTRCGHLFHEKCLLRWLKRSASCPECRVSCHERRMHRVFLNFGERTAADDELDVKVEELEDPHWEYLDEPLRVGVAFEMPADAIKAGVDSDGNDAYVARVPFEQDLLPANFVPAKGAAYAPWGCWAQLLTDDVELLLGKNYKWVAASDGNVPENAIPTGSTSTGETLYTARTQYEGRLLPGKLHPSHGVIYMPYCGKEVNRKQYEVLVKVPKEEPTQEQLVATTA